ncbi:DnaD domain-containing protein [Streptococcus pacificus]|uniref:DnaD domain-containing protein n=1 Tax=Streptococcus pacificus TaxID=2740577 RepID=A0ABS0ZHJ0_9STRE|nr:DnaD domain-containing protein [Streptococcus pacificus]MBJ8325460.1 DnaD domain-containing protein [Streptococcus pacificus]
MSFSKAFDSGTLVLPSELLFHFHEIFENVDDYLVWQFFYLQNTSKIEEIAPSHIAKAIGKTVLDVNRSISSLKNAELLEIRTIELAGDSEIIFDASPALKKLDELFQTQDVSLLESDSQEPTNIIKPLVESFEKELGRMLSPFELEDLTKLVNEDKTDPEIILAALKEAVFNGKTNWKYIQAILRNWRREGITTLRQVEEKRRAREEADPKNVAISDDFKTALNLWSD